MTTSMPVLGVQALPWDMNLSRRERQVEEEPLPDVGVQWEFRNRSQNWLLLVTSDNKRYRIAPRPDDVGTVQIYRRFAIRDAVRVDEDEVYSVDGVTVDTKYVGLRVDLIRYRERRIGRTIPSHIATMGLNKHRRFNENDAMDSVGDQFTIKLEELEFNKSVYLPMLDCVLVKLSAEPTRNEVRRYNHPYHARYRHKREHTTVDFMGQAFETRWVCPDTDEQYSLWLNVGGKAFEIAPHPGAGVPGLYIRYVASDREFHIPADEILKNPLDYNVYLTQEAARNWRNPMQRDAAKHAMETETNKRKAETNVLDELRAELKSERERGAAMAERLSRQQKDFQDELKRSREEAEAEAKRRHDEFMAEMKRRDEAEKQRQADADAKRQRTVDIWKAAAAIAGAIVGIGLAFMKLLEKAVAK